MIDPAKTGPRTLVLGDSWVCGLSKGQGTLSRLLPEELEASEVLNLSKISRIVPHIVADHLSEIDEFAPEFALLAIGGADSLIFPAPWFQRFIDRVAPPKWQGIEGLQPSAKIVRDPKKRIKHQAEQLVKTILKQLMVNLFGGHRRVPMEELEAGSRCVLQLLADHGTAVVVIGCSDVDHFTSPKSCKNIRRSNRMLAGLAREYPNVFYVDPSGVIDKWDDYLVDKVHLTRDGHRKLTDAIVARMLQAGSPWADRLPADGRACVDLLDDRRRPLPGPGPQPGPGPLPGPGPQPVLQPEPEAQLAG